MPASTSAAMVEELVALVVAVDSSTSRAIVDAKHFDLVASFIDCSMSRN